MTDLRVAGYRLAKRQREAAEQTALVLGGPPQLAPASRYVHVDGFAPVRVSPPMISGPMAITVALGVRWTAPAGSKVLPGIPALPDSICVQNGDTGHLHALRVNERGAVEEVSL